MARLSENGSRFLIIPCEAPGCEDLSVIWDSVEEQVIDVMTAAEVRAYSLESLA